MFAAIMHTLCCWIVELGCDGAATYGLIVKTEEPFAKVFGLMVQDCRRYTEYFPLFLWMEHGVYDCQVLRTELNINKNTTVDFNNYMREVCAASLLKALCVSHRR